ncbi:hypothetical protein CO051_05755 [Candidatus Roizmanbacteria bacterium CG_4_9_14_0_2_um_filter_39_13]|uniref:DegT/DnrJ/EryC1/StrS aminotransferase family protein n=2 Tax=Candidatus Roizmaniibacteriota TaxID=1752723 RepID=A0A2M8EX58_9BACT|nr:MAG: hypothetical protein COY15_04760 [Candidatus Roizmanbacteria bacterium CG_4_10_14_0_2_um_filter_39_12]PJC30429.1 MAG: hypothetical protein CO051_05755 [Candidatus Roizmanbacteria bacterium CG_4_9_14_0_2_um_filter_39_13]PJE61650.1 MAG: hypothetical protein COU87_03370 [Candidatus Roizmanbacteria bacterium CG10_big_fil_rev_8_21_14_0_10_39_12]
MIFIDFALNETKSDAMLAFRLFFQPWRWRKGKEINNLKRRLKTRFFSSDSSIFFFLTGRAALYQYLSSLGLKKGDEILVQGFTCEAVVLPILELGFKPVYVDVNSSDFSMSIKDVKNKYTSKAKAMLIQHTFGITPTDRKELIEFANKHSLHIIEDVAHGFDPNIFRSKRYPGAVLMSFGRSKSFSSVFGGAIAVRGVRSGKSVRAVEKNIPNPSVWILLQTIFYKIHSVIIKSTYDIFLGKIIHFLFKQLYLMMPEVTKKEKNGHFNFMFLATYPNIAAIFMHAQLDRFNDVLTQRKKTSYIYDAKLGTSISRGQGLLRYPFLCENPNELQTLLKKHRIQTGRWYSQVVAPPELDLLNVDYIRGSCPIAESLCKRVLNLPTHISVRDAKRILNLLP